MMYSSGNSRAGPGHRILRYRDLNIKENLFTLSDFFVVFVVVYLEFCQLVSSENPQESFYKKYY